MDIVGLISVATIAGLAVLASMWFQAHKRRQWTRHRGGRYYASPKRKPTLRA
jgi:hypothetical protein